MGMIGKPVEHSADNANNHVITRLLLNWRDGDLSAYDQLAPLVYDELHRIAQSQMRKERQGHTLQPSALVNEAFLRLLAYDHVNWKSRQHFFSLAAKMMRQVLVNYAASRKSQKRGGAMQRVVFDERFLMVDTRHDFVALDDALSTLAGLDPRRAQVVELRFFGGLTLAETAQALGVSSDTVMRDWKLAKAWLLRELKDSPGNDR